MEVKGSIMDEKKGRVLILEDEEGIGILLKTLLEDADYDVMFVGDAATASQIVDAADFDVVISDFKMPGQTGLQFFTQHILDLPQGKRPAFVLISGYLRDAQSLVRPLPQRIPFLEKPFTAASLLTVVNSEVLLRKYRHRLTKQR